MSKPTMLYCYRGVRGGQISSYVVFNQFYSLIYLTADVGLVTVNIYVFLLSTFFLFISVGSAYDVTDISSHSLFILIGYLSECTAPNI